MIKKIQISDTNVVEEVRQKMPVATSNLNGLYDKRFVINKKETGAKNNLLVKMFDRRRKGFTGKITVIFHRNENAFMHEYNLYAVSFDSVAGYSNIQIYKRCGEPSSIGFYVDNEYVYAYISGQWHSVAFILDYIHRGELILSEEFEVDISSLNKMSFAN